MVQRLPVVAGDTNLWGSVLNGFLLVAHNPDGTLIVPGFSNPMLGQGDMITGGLGGIAQRLAAGANGQFLGMTGGFPTWLNLPTGFPNPMTNQGDVITGGVSGVAQRLGIGINGQVLGVSSGVPQWITNPSGFPNPMIAQGDFILGGVGGAPGPLHLGANGQVIQSNGTTAVWANNPAGFPNPMTTPNDLILGGTAGAAQRLAVGTNGQFLGVVAGSVVWANPSTFGTPRGGPSPTQQTIWQQPDGSMLVLPLSTYSLSGDDATWINTAFGLSDTVYLIAATYNITATVNVPWYGRLFGHKWNTILNYLGNGSCLSMVDPQLSQPTNRHLFAGSIIDVLIDATSAGANAILLDTQDLTGGCNLQIMMRNATGANAVAWRCANNNLALNWITGKVIVQNCTLGVLFTALGSQTAIEHINIHLDISMNNAGQNGIHLTNSAGLQGCWFSAGLGANISSAGFGIVMDANTAFSNCFFAYKHEMNPAPGTAGSIQFNATSAKFSNCFGSMFFGPNLIDATGISSPNTNGQFTFFGSIVNDANLIAAQTPGVNTQYQGKTLSVPAVPPSTVAATNNNGVNVWITLAGGTLTAATSISGVGTVGDTATRTFLLPDSHTITLTYSVAPTWTWQPV